MTGDTLTVEIVSIGAAGDGIAETPRGTLYVPFTAPGDVARVEIGEPRGEGHAAEVVERLRDGPDRVDPTCRHFGTCGGCALQHLAPQAYANWVRARVASALKRRGLDAGVVDAPILVPPGTRRRARFALRRRRGRLRLAFRERRSARLVAIEECPVLRPEMADRLPRIAEGLALALAQEGQLGASLTALERGFDLLIFGSDPPGERARRELPDAARRAGLARIGWQTDDGPPELIVQLASVRIDFSGVEVELPLGAFLQPTEEGEAALVETACGALEGAKRVADLYAGCGPFTLALARAETRITACETDEAMVGALTGAARAAGLGALVSAETRDLDRRPLIGGELAGLDGVVLDPPRGGAAAQAASLAASAVPTIVYASCNPASFARDARTLVDGGYRIERVTPVGQFLWSAEVELIAVLRQ